MAAWADLPEELQGNAWFTLPDLSKLVYLQNALLELANRDIKLVAVGDDTYVQINGYLTPLILDEFEGKPVLSVGDLL